MSQSLFVRSLHCRRWRNSTGSTSLFQLNQTRWHPCKRILLLRRRIIIKWGNDCRVSTWRRSRSVWLTLLALNIWYCQSLQVAFKMRGSKAILNITLKIKGIIFIRRYCWHGEQWRRKHQAKGHDCACWLHGSHHHRSRIVVCRKYSKNGEWRMKISYWASLVFVRSKGVIRDSVDKKTKL